MQYKIRKWQVVADFRDVILPDIIKRYGPNDKPAKAEAWNNYTYALYKNGQITQKQYETWMNPF